MMLAPEPRILAYVPMCGDDAKALAMTCFVGLLQVLMVTQQAAQALSTDSSDDEQQVNVANAVAACLCQHFR